MARAVSLPVAIERNVVVHDRIFGPARCREGEGVIEGVVESDGVETVENQK